MDVNSTATWSRNIIISTNYPRLSNLSITRETRSHTGHHTGTDLDTWEIAALVILLVELVLMIMLIAVILKRR